MQTYNREYKSSVFIMLFSDPKVLLTLYNAVNGTEYKNADDLVINTLEGDSGTVSGVFSGMKNDISFVFHSSLNLYEHQSTNPTNIPVRFLLYLSDLIKNTVTRTKLYGTGKVLLPTPRFVVFYNGSSKMQDVETYRLSDLFEISEKDPSLDLKVTVYNINSQHNKVLMERCRYLAEYALFVDRARNALADKKTENAKRVALEDTIDGCIRDNILQDFLTQNREAILMSYYWEYNQEEHDAAMRDDGIEEGREKGHDELASLLSMLFEMNKGEDAQRVLTDKQYRKELLAKYKEQLC